MNRDRAIGGITSTTAFEGVPVDCPSEESMGQTFRTLQWLADNYESPGSPEHEALLEGAHTMGDSRIRDLSRASRLGARGRPPAQISG